MHYSRFQHSKYQGQPVILPIQNSSAEIGQRVGVSPIDIQGVRRYYGCEPYQSDSITFQPETLMNAFSILFVVVAVVALIIILLKRFLCVKSNDVL